MKFILLLVSLLFCEDLEDLLRKRLYKKHFNPISTYFKKKIIALSI
ncbi:hypothetical protein AAJ76_140005015 [Vairimorpha ceranae]|uniref:Uncharacterized protein n=1 Tax=Vairimorpha ceranae TaxID=40302 RepID=A0A0F9WE48_9MICR|nr:hypothetical protein AAJ76_140005015 [Vairimorpha ceranae]KKO75676.1 hypothetical protein AAJ76_140005015 [Vairimorpha ceranae]